MTFRDRWKHELKSDRHIQIQGQLRCGLNNLPNTFGYCCLGVAGNILVASNKTEWVGDELKSDEAYTDGALTNEMAAEFGLTGVQQSILVCLNDDFRLNFHQIADALDMPEFINAGGTATYSPENNKAANEIAAIIAAKFGIFKADEE
jgi:hypothetical protein